MIRKLRTQRDNQQWMLDLSLNMRGRVQNFEIDAADVPPGKRKLKKSGRIAYVRGNGDGP